MSGELRVDPLSGRAVVIAPGRARRPGAAGARIPEATPEELDACPFCEGREDRTPPEVLALGRNSSAADAPGWRVRVVPNLYPAFERQEVVVHSPRHLRSFVELEGHEIELAAEAWRARARAARDAGFAYLHALVNEGRDAGASLPHSHSQLVWMRARPPAVAAEESDGECRLCSLLAREQADEARLVTSRAGVAAVSAFAGRVPYELLVAPLEHREDAFEDDLLADGLRLLAECVHRLRALEGPIPWNAWLHTGSHWHLEVVPRLTVLAGVELGAGIYVNTLAPEEAAERLRSAAPAL